ncbi:hypothetical protein DFH29DRAFT_937021 [Suillus ampliporus]|nr:hypothetical protein DFH29DRAFT_937021 [Suillus ampliporus]
MVGASLLIDIVMRLSTVLLACLQLNGAHSHSMRFPAFVRYFSSLRTFVVRPIYCCARVLIMVHHGPFVGFCGHRIASLTRVLLVSM